MKDCIQKHTFRILLLTNFQRSCPNLYLQTRGMSFWCCLLWRFLIQLKFFYSSACWIVCATLTLILSNKYRLQYSNPDSFQEILVYNNTYSHLSMFCNGTSVILCLYCMVINQPCFLRVLDDRSPTLNLFQGHHRILQNFGWCGLVFPLLLFLLFPLN